MSDNKLLGAAIGFILGIVLGLQMCSSCRGSSSGGPATIDWQFGIILGIFCAILGAIIAQDKKDE